MTEPLIPDPELLIFQRDTFSSLDPWPPLNQNSWQDTLWTEQCMIAQFFCHATYSSGDLYVEWKRTGTGINDTMTFFTTPANVYDIQWRVDADFSPPELGWGGALTGVAFSFKMYNVEG